MNTSVLNRLMALIATSLFLVIGIVLLKEASLHDVKNIQTKLPEYTIHS